MPSSFIYVYCFRGPRKDLNIYCKYIYKKKRVDTFLLTFFFLLSWPERRLRLSKFATAWVADQIENVYSEFEGIFATLVGGKAASQKTQASLVDEKRLIWTDLMDSEAPEATSVWGSPSTKGDCEARSYHWGLLQSEERRLLDFGWCTEQKDSLLMKKGTFDFVMDMVMITVRTVFCFFWRSCFGGQPTWHEHRFGYVNSVRTFIPPLSSVFTLENAQLCKSLLLHAQRRWRNYRNLFFWCGATCSVRFVSWLKCFFSGYLYILTVLSMKLWDMRPTRRNCPLPRHQDHIQL